MRSCALKRLRKKRISIVGNGITCPPMPSVELSTSWDATAGPGVDDREPRSNKGDNRHGDERRQNACLLPFFSDTSHSASNVQDARRPNLMRRIAAESTYVLTSETHLPIQENYPIISRNREGSKSTPRMAPAGFTPAGTKKSLITRYATVAIGGNAASRITAIMRTTVASTPK